VCLLRGTCLAAPNAQRPGLHTQPALSTHTGTPPPWPTPPANTKAHNSTAVEHRCQSHSYKEAKDSLPSPSQANSSGRTVQRLQLTSTARSRVPCCAEADSYSAVFVEPASGPYPDPDESTQQPPISFNLNVSLILLSIPRSTSPSLSFSIPTEIPYASLACFLQTPPNAAPLLHHVTKSGAYI